MRPQALTRGLLPLLLLASLAGCSSEDGTPGRGSLEALELPWSLTGCRFAVVLVEVPAERVAAHVPEGFRVMSVAEAIGGEPGLGAGAPSPNGDGNFGVEAFQCDEGQGLDGTVAGLSYGSYVTAVEPPAELRRNVDLHFVKWDTLVPDEPRRLLLQQYGLLVRAGSAVVALGPAQGSLASYTATLDFGGEETLELAGNSLAPREDFTFVEYTRTPRGLATWSSTLDVSQGGSGPHTVVVPEGGKATDVVGRGEHRAFGFAGVADVTGGLIEAPAVP